LTLTIKERTVAQQGLPRHEVSTIKDLILPNHATSLGAATIKN